MSKVMIMAGGTGGHIYPAAAVAEQLIEDGFSICWLGSRRGMEKSIVSQLGYEFFALPVTAWHGGGIRKLIAPFNLIRALFFSLKIVDAEQPDLVMGFGGYASAPGGMAAWLRKIPLVLHEQNGVPGLTNKKLENKAQRVLQAFPNTFAKPYEVTGNPVRAALCNLPHPKKRKLGEGSALNVLILGGSQGAQSLNELLPKAIDQLKSQRPLKIRHQTGQGKQEETVGRYSSDRVEASVVEYIDDMAEAYAWSDLVIARSGASTVSELAAVGCYSILLPYPWHQDRQQFKNADWLSNQSAAEWHDQDELSAEQLAERIDYWNDHRAELQEKAILAWSMGIRNSAQRIVNVVKDVLENETL